MCSHRGDVKLALDRAKEASTKERSLIRWGLCDAQGWEFESLESDFLTQVKFSLSWIELTRILTHLLHPYRLREQASLTDSHNLDLTFSVLFNLANQYAANEMYTEALNTYQVIMIKITCLYWLLYHQELDWIFNTL